MTELADQQAQEHQEPVADAVVQIDNSAPAEKPLSIREGIEAAVKEARARDEKTGQFVKQEAKPEPAPEKVEAAKPVSEAPPEPSPAAPAVKPPPGWSEESKAFFNALPADHPLRKDVAKREEEVSGGFKKYGDIAKRHEEIEGIIAPRRQGYQQHGLSDAQAINSLFAWEESFRNPATRAIAFQNLARAWQFDLTSLAQSPQPAQGETQQQPSFQQPAHDPRLDSVVQELNELKSGNIQREIAAFAQGKPHFDAVRELMGKLLNGGAANTMDEAYQTALKIHPEVSQLIAKEAADKAEAERKKAAEDKARAAAAASASVRGSSPQGEVANSRKPQRQSSVRESLKQAIAEARA